MEQDGTKWNRALLISLGEDEGGMGCLYGRKGVNIRREGVGMGKTIVQGEWR